jgi:hypothetical protein
MRQTGIVHPRLLEDLVAGGFFPWRAELQGPTKNRGSAGTILDAWTAVEGLRDIPAARGGGTGEEVRAPEMITEVNRVVWKLAGLYAGINPGWRVVVTHPQLGTVETFDITGVDTDAVGLMTHLTCVARTPVANQGE